MLSKVQDPLRTTPGGIPKGQEPLPMWKLRDGGAGGVRTVRDGDNDLAHELRLLGVGVLSVQHDVGGADLACGAVQAIELVGGVDAIHQGAVLPQIRVHSYHLPREEQNSYCSPGPRPKLRCLSGHLALLGAGSGRVTGCTGIRVWVLWHLH